MRESRKRRRTNWVKRSSGAAGSKRKKSDVEKMKKIKRKKDLEGW